MKNRIDDFKKRYRVLPFGSREWGGALSKSDWDYVMEARHIQTIFDELNTTKSVKGIQWNVYNENLLKNVASVKYEEDGDSINLIFYADKDMQMIEDLNKHLNGFESDILKSKEMRCYFVEMFIAKYSCDEI